MKSIRWIGWVAVILFGLIIWQPATVACTCQTMAHTMTVNLSTSTPAADLSPPVCAVVTNSAICGDTKLAGSGFGSYQFVNAVNTRDGAKENGSVPVAIAPARDCLMSNSVNTVVNYDRAANEDFPGVSALVLSGEMIKAIGYAATDITKLAQPETNLENVRISSMTKSARDWLTSNSLCVLAEHSSRSSGNYGLRSPRDLIWSTSSVGPTDGNYWNLGGGIGDIRMPRDLSLHGGPRPIGVVPFKPARDGTTCQNTINIWAGMIEMIKKSDQGPADATNKTPIAIRPISKTVRWV